MKCFLTPTDQDGMGQKFEQLQCTAFSNVCVSLPLLKNYVYNCTSLAASWGGNKQLFPDSEDGLLPLSPLPNSTFTHPNPGMLHPITVFILFCPVSHIFLSLSKSYLTVALQNACSYIYRVWESYEIYGHSSKGKCTLFWTLRRFTLHTFLKLIYECPRSSRCPETWNW